VTWLKTPFTGRLKVMQTALTVIVVVRSSC
jgi:hypothetical protein